MTDTPKPTRPAGRATAAPVEGERRIVAKIDAAPQDSGDRRAAALRNRREAATAPAKMRTRTQVGPYLDENRRVMSALEGVVSTDLLGSTRDPNPLLKSYPDTVTKGKAVSNTRSDPRAAQARQAQASASFSTAMSQFGIRPEFDNYDMLDMMAQHLVQLLQSNVYAYANLSKYERNLLFRYFAKYNPVVARVVDLHTDLPLSKARLQPPQDVPELVRDYVMQFFERVFSRLNLNEILRQMVVSYYVHGECFTQVDDDFSQQADRILQDVTHIEEKVFEHSEGDLRFMQQVEEKYRNKPKDVPLEDRNRYVKIKFANFFDQNYQGPNKLSVLHFYNVMEYLENPDIAFEAIRYSISDSMKRLLDMKLNREELVDLGYSKGFLDLHDEGGQADSYVIDNDIYSGLPFIFSFKRSDGDSLLTRILSELCEWDAAQRAVKAKIEHLGKLGRVITAEGTSEQQLAHLENEVRMMLEDPNHAIVSNYKIEWNEVNSFIKEELNELIKRLGDLKMEIAMGAGIPDSLMAGDAAYSGDNIKLDLLNTYYMSFNQRLQTVIEEKLIKPIAMRKGFIAIDEWGYPTLIYPRLTFTRLGLRDAGILETLFQLYQKGSLPLEIILDVLNLDPEHVRRGIERDMFTPMDVNMNGLLQELYVQAAADVYQETTLKEKLEKALGLVKRYGDELATTPDMQDAENTDDKDETETHQPKDRRIYPKMRDDKGPLQKNTHGIQAKRAAGAADPLAPRKRDTGGGGFQHTDPEHAPRHDLRKRKHQPDNDISTADPDLSMADPDLSTADPDLVKGAKTR